MDDGGKYGWLWRRRVHSLNLNGWEGYLQMECMISGV